MKEVIIYTDGACSGNPGVGGWCAILMYKGHTKTVSGYNKFITNNRMELFSFIQGLSQLKEKCKVSVYSDSAYVVNAINQGWLKSWENNLWKNKTDTVKITTKSRLTISVINLLIFSFFATRFT